MRSLSRARLRGPKLAKSPSAASGRDSAAARGEGGPGTGIAGRGRAGPEKVTESRGRRRGPGPARRRRRRGSRGGAGAYLSCFSGSSACSGRWLALPQSQLLSRGCLPHCTRPGAPRPARLAAGTEETGAGPIRAAVVGGAGRGGSGAASWGGEPGQPGRKGSLTLGGRGAGRPRAGTLCWREDLTSRPASSPRDRAGGPAAPLSTPQGPTSPNLTVPSLTTAHAAGKIRHATILPPKSRLRRNVKHKVREGGGLEGEVLKANYPRPFRMPGASAARRTWKSRHICTRTATDTAGTPGEEAGPALCARAPPPACSGPRRTHCPALLTGQLLNAEGSAYKYHRGTMLLKH